MTSKNKSSKSSEVGVRSSEGSREWDPSKAKKNIKIHGVSFDEASTAFKDTLSITIYDTLHSD